MSFSIVRSQRSLTIPRKISADTGGSLVGQSVAGLGGAIANIGIKYDLMEATAQFSETKRKITERWNELSLSLQQNPDSSTYQPEYDKVMAEVKTYVPKNRRAARAIGEWVNDKAVGWQKILDDSIYARQQDSLRTENFNLRQVYIEQGGQENYMNYLVNMHQAHKLGAYTSEQAEMFLQKTIKDRERFEKSEAVRIKAQTKEEYDAYVEKIEQDWLAKLRARELAASDIMDSALEVDKKQEWLGYVDKQAEEVLKGEDVTTNEEAKGRLEKMAYDIWTGAVDVDDFNKAIKVARYTDKTIDDAAYDELVSLAQREHKSYQAKAVTNAISDAARQLIDYETESALQRRMDIVAKRLSGEAFKKEEVRILSKRQLQFAHHAMYRRAINQWFKEHPDATGDEIDIEAQKILSRYRKRTVPQAELFLKGKMRAPAVPPGLPVPRDMEIDVEVKGKPPSSPPPKDRSYIGFTVLQNGTNIKWVWDGNKWQRAQ